MRKLLVLFIFLLGISSMSSFVYSTDQTLGDTNIRFEPCIGHRAAGIDFEMTDEWIQNEYDRYLKPLAQANPQILETTNLCIMKKITWRNFYVKNLEGPENSAQARDPSWSNYKWNTDDSIKRLLDHPLVKDGKMKVHILIADQSSAQRNAPPKWFINDGHTFGEPPEVSPGVFRTKLYDEEARSHVVDFYTAFFNQYKDEKDILGVTLGEYYAGDAEYFPPEMSIGDYRNGRVLLVEEIMNNVPLDENGNRVAVYQTNPSVKSGSFTEETLLRLGVGTSQSDVRIFFGGCTDVTDDNRLCEDGTIERITQNTRGVLPHLINGDTRFAREGRGITWPDITNPFGHGPGFKQVFTPQEIVWYYSSKGVVKLDSIFMGLTTNSNLHAQNVDNYADAMVKFGHGGTLVDEWGEFGVSENSLSSGGGGGSDDPPENDEYSACHQIKVSDPIPDLYGAPYDYGTNLQIVQGTCSNTNLNLEIPKFGDIIYIYEKGHIWRNDQWEEFTLSGNKVAGTQWLRNSASASFSGLDTSEENYVVTYACRWSGANWKCGCRNRGCNDKYWNLQIFQK